MKIFFVDRITPEAYRHLEDVAEVIQDWDRIGEVDAIISKGLPLTKKELTLAKNLKVIGLHGTGSDHVDIAAAEALGIDCFTAPHLNAQSVAELEAGLILSLSRKIALADRLFQAGQSLAQANDPVLMGQELCGKTLGIIGVGHIGILVANFFKLGLGMKVIGYDPFFTPERAKELDYGWCESKEQVLSQADVVSLNLPLTPETQLMIGAQQFALMKPTAYFINVSRGFLVDEDALYDALKNGVIAGAASDVRQQEPVQVHDRFLSLPNFLLTPHIGANTAENMGRSDFYVIDEVVRRLEEKGVE